MEEEESKKEARVDEEESSEHEIGILASQSSSDSLFSAESEESEVVKYRRYVLCYDELTGSKFNTFFDNLCVKKFDSGLLCFEDVLEISHIKYNDGEEVDFPEETMAVEDLVIMNAWMKACKNKKPFFVVPQNAQQLKFISFLYLIHNNILSEMPILKLLPNNKEEFKLKHVLPLLQYIFEDDLFALRCDVPSVIYKNTDKTLFETITVDFTVMYKETELVSIEVKPYNLQESLVELDKVRVAEISKKRLHKRMITSKTAKEFSTFGATVVGDDVELYQLKFVNDEYNYCKVGCFTLPTTSSTYAFLPVALDVLISFKELIKNTLPSQEEENMPYIMDVTKKMKPTTLYLL